MQLHQPKSSVPPVQTNKLFFWFWMRWRALTVGERFVCANIILIPLWWVAGIYRFMPILLLGCVLTYEWLQHKEIRLKRPSTAVVALFAFGMYQLVRMVVHYSDPERPSFSGVILTWFCYALFLWYIQSNNVKIRIEAIAWACTVSVIQMLGFCFLLQFVLPPDWFVPPRFYNLLGLLAGGSSSEEAGQFMIAPYEMASAGGSGVVRLSLFFISAQFFSLVVGCIGLVALDIKNKLWSLLLLFACVFLIVLSFSRILWITFPIAVVFRYLFSTFGKPKHRPIFFGLLAVTSFTTLSIPLVSDFLINGYTDLTQSINQFRAESSEQRSEIYRQTWEAFLESPLWGYIGKGAHISLATGDQNVIGSHSVILGNLLYNNGLIGTAIFATFWISLFVWLYKTRTGRPLTGLCVMILFTLASPTLSAMWFSTLSALIILLCVAIRSPKSKSASDKSVFRRSGYA